MERQEDWKFLWILFDNCWSTNTAQLPSTQTRYCWLRILQFSCSLWKKGTGKEILHITTTMKAFVLHLVISKCQLIAIAKQILSVCKIRSGRRSQGCDHTPFKKTYHTVSMVPYLLPFFSSPTSLATIGGLSIALQLLAPIQGGCETLLHQNDSDWPCSGVNDCIYAQQQRIRSLSLFLPKFPFSTCSFYHVYSLLFYDFFLSLSWYTDNSLSHSYFPFLLEFSIFNTFYCWPPSYSSSEKALKKPKDFSSWEETGVFWSALSALQERSALAETAGI